MLSLLPHLNAVFNALSTSLLLAGYWQIRHGNRRNHRRLMIGAFSVSVLFLLSYLTYHIGAGVVTFGGKGALRTVYLGILAVHTTLAASVPFLATLTLFRGLRNDVARHRAIARWTLPIWLTVNITGILVYILVYQTGAAGGG